MPTNEEKIHATKPLLTFGAITMAIWIALGTASIYLLNQIVGLLFLGFAAFSVFIVIRRQMCGSCYYCASCTKGFAKTSRLFLGSNHIPGISKGSTIGMTVHLYILLTVIPGALLVSSLMQQFSLINAVLLAGLLAVTVYNAIAHALDLQK